MKAKDKAKVAPKAAKSKEDTKKATKQPSEEAIVVQSFAQNGLTKADVAFFQKFFDTERDAILAGHSMSDDKFKVDQDSRADEADVASAELAQEMGLRLRNREVLYLKKIDEALDKIRVGSYGECDSCGGFIGLKRLQARPTATLCIDCKTEQERNENRSIDGNRSKSLGSSFFPKN